MYVASLRETSEFMTDPKPAFLQCAAIIGRKRTDPAELERRKAYALELLRAGTPRKAVSVQAKLEPAWVRAIAEEHSIPSLARAPAKNRLPDAVRADRERVALGLLHAGHTRAYAAERSGLTPVAVKRVADAHGIAKQPSGPRVKRTRDVTRMTHAELDALERSVAAQRTASVRWRTAVTVLRSEPAGGAYVEVGE